MMAAQTLNPGHTLHSLLEGLVDSLPAKDIYIEGLCIDSRKVEKGDLFFAMAGGQGHGLVYAADAVKKGAAAIVYEDDSRLQEWPEAVIALDEVKNKVTCIAASYLQEKLGLIADRFFNHPSQQQFVIGVTGTNGKTSCCQFIAETINRQASCGVIGTLGNGVYGNLQASTHTTPDAVEVHRLLADMLQQGVQQVAMEVSSHGLSQGRVNGVNFDIAVFTNLSRDHLDYHEDMDSYAAAKRILFDMPELRYAVINIDDDYGRQLLKDMPETVQTVAYSIKTNPYDVENAMSASSATHLGCVCGEKLQLTAQGMSMQVTTPWGEGTLRSDLLGRFNASNLLACLAVLLLKGIRIQDALELIGRVGNVPGRMQHYAGSNGLPLVVVDYAHTPDALDSVLSSLSEHCQGKLWCVFGCGGDRDRGKRPLMASVAERIADFIIVTDDNPRTEHADVITDDIISGLQKPEHANVIHERAEAIRYALRNAGEFDVVLIAGKGHENYQIIGTQRLPFSDEEEVKKWLAEVSV